MILWENLQYTQEKICSSFIKKSPINTLCIGQILHKDTYIILGWGKFFLFINYCVFLGKRYTWSKYSSVLMISLGIGTCTIMSTQNNKTKISGKFINIQIDIFWYLLIYLYLYKVVILVCSFASNFNGNSGDPLEIPVNQKIVGNGGIN